MLLFWRNPEIKGRGAGWRHQCGKIIWEDFHNNMLIYTIHTLNFGIIFFAFELFFWNLWHRERELQRQTTDNTNTSFEVENYTQPLYACESYMELEHISNTTAPLFVAHKPQLTDTKSQTCPLMVMDLMLWHISVSARANSGIKKRKIRCMGDMKLINAS